MLLIFRKIKNPAPKPVTPEEPWLRGQERGSRKPYRELSRSLSLPTPYPWHKATQRKQKPSYKDLPPLAAAPYLPAPCPAARTPPAGSGRQRLLPALQKPGPAARIPRAPRSAPAPFLPAERRGKHAANQRGVCWARKQPNGRARCWVAGSAAAGGEVRGRRGRSAPLGSGPGRLGGGGRGLGWAGTGPSAPFPFLFLFPSLFLPFPFPSCVACRLVPASRQGLWVLRRQPSLPPPPSEGSGAARAASRRASRLCKHWARAPPCLAAARRGQELGMLVSPAGARRWMRPKRASLFVSLGEAWRLPEILELCWKVTGS